MYPTKEGGALGFGEFGNFLTGREKKLDFLGLERGIER